MEPCEHEPSNGAYGDWIFQIHLELMGPFYQPFLCNTNIYLFRKRIKINKHIIINLWPEEKELKKIGHQHRTSFENPSFASIKSAY